MTYFLELCKYDCIIHCSSLIALLHNCCTTVWVGSYNSNKLWPLPCFWFTSVLVMWICAYPCCHCYSFSPCAGTKDTNWWENIKFATVFFFFFFLKCLFLAILQWYPPKEKQQQKWKGNVFVYSCGCMSGKSVHHTVESCSIREADK